mmetsp:Transcript_94695/g.305710  ORF Transcript_94695/g.305710 Transcript_94695/m.305710 type:complete len:238 (+) Transcript_94695:1092-1805(+)
MAGPRETGQKDQVDQQKRQHPPHGLRKGVPQHFEPYMHPEVLGEADKAVNEIEGRQAHSVEALCDGVEVAILMRRPRPEDAELLVVAVDVDKPGRHGVDVDAEIRQLHVVPDLREILQALRVYLRGLHQEVVADPTSEDHLQTKAEAVCGGSVDAEAAGEHLHGGLQPAPGVGVDSCAHGSADVVVGVVGVDLDGEASCPLVRPALPLHGGDELLRLGCLQWKVHDVAETAKLLGHQ